MKLFRLFVVSTCQQQKQLKAASSSSHSFQFRSLANTLSASTANADDLEATKTTTTKNSSSSPPPSLTATADTTSPFSFCTGARELVEKICENFASKGRPEFVLPWADKRAIDAALFPFQELLELGVRPEFLGDACARREQLFREMIRRGRSVFQILEVFVENFAMNFEDAIRFISRFITELDTETPDSIQSRINVFSARGLVAGISLRKLFEKCPALLFAADAQKIDKCLEHLSNYFERADLKKVAINTPHICLIDPLELESRYEYIFYHMGITGEELATSNRWMDLDDLFEIIDRHQLLLKTGKYFFPDPKRPQLKKENPKAKIIFDTPVQKFAQNVAGVEHEEWLVFRELSEQKRQWEDKEEPFERIKPSKRKAYERQKKQAREEVEGEIE